MAARGRADTGPGEAPAGRGVDRDRVGGRARAWGAAREGGEITRPDAGGGSLMSGTPFTARLHRLPFAPAAAAAILVSYEFFPPKTEKMEQTLW